jgi:hypothetical protein
MGVSSRSPVPGASQYGLAVSSSVVTLTVPATARTAEIFVRGASIVFTRDGTNPTATAGFQADVADIIVLNARKEIQALEMIRKSTDATVDVEYFTDVSG